MKREILFRGLRLDGKGWVEGLPIFLTEYAKDYSEIDGIQCCKTRENYDITPETVGQFTGLLDKNGNRIFEGDILTGCGEVFWNEEIANCGCCFQIVACGFDFGEDANKLEIIGNIHEKKKEI